MGAEKGALVGYFSRNIVFAMLRCGCNLGGGPEQEQISCSADDMQLMYDSGETEKGNYADLSYADVKAVVTPAFRLHDGIYEIQASFSGGGLLRQG